MKKIFLPCLLILLSNIIFAQKNKQLDSLFTTLYKTNQFNGNVLVAEKGKIIYEKSFGLANETTKQALNSNTIFELASVSKQFTAMGIVLLAKEGKLQYDDLISKYIPELAFYGNITIKNLIYHTSGLPDYMSLFYKNWDKTKFAVNQDIVNLLAEHKPELLFPIGQQFDYSNTGYALLGLIIEKVSGMPFADYLHKKIFSPLKMKHTLVYRSRYKPQKVKNYALGYVTDSLGNKFLLDSLGKEFYTYYLDGIVGDGMVNSTAKDLLKWDRALYSNKFINNDDKELIFNSIKTLDDKSNNYGFGWFISKNDLTGKIVQHSGGWAGYVTYIERHLDTDKTIIILQNNDTETTVLPSKKVRDLLYSVKPIKLEEEYLKTLIGKYQIDENKFTEITFENGKLYSLIQPDTKLELEPLSKSKFKLIGFNPDVFYEFVFENDKPIKYIINQPAQNIVRDVLKIE